MAKRSDLREKKTGQFYLIGMVSACLLLWVCIGVWSIQTQLPYPEAESAEGVVAASDCADAFSGKLPDTLQSELRIHQFTGWGVEKLGSTNASGKRVWILDSGVSLWHPDLVVDTLLSRNFVNQDSTRPAEDDNGHGTMIAGIIAAKDNDFGVKGIAAGATVVALKVLNSRAKGSYTDLINGIRYATLHAHPGEVAVICLGGPTWKKLDDAVLELAEKGVYVVISAGNHSSFANEYSPARVKHRNIYVVAGIDQHYNVLPKSNFGTPPITHCAPGKEILSTSLNGSYSQDSGSSMAAPHVAGMLLINDGKINSEPKAFCLYDQQTFYPVVKR
jgi:subtilisin family serine protease